MTLQFPPDEIVDIREETGVRAVQKLGRIVAEKGGKCFGVPVTWESERNVGVVCRWPVSRTK
jgi:hypothetical protein